MFEVLFVAPIAQTAAAQIVPSVRYLSIESKMGSSCTVIWSVFHVAQWADQIHFRLWAIRGSENFLAGYWSIGLDDHIDQYGEQIMPGFGIQGIYDNNVTASQIIAESPFAAENRTNPIDGLQTYYFYKSRLTFNFTFKESDILLLAADYENEPQYYNGELPYYGPYNTGDYYRAEYANIPNGGIYPIFPIESEPTLSTQLSISVDASSVAVGAAVNVNGRLSDADGNPLQNKTVTLSYAVAGSTSWVPIGSGTTNAAGEYDIQWVNAASGTFALKAEWSGDANYWGTSNTTTLSFLPYENQNVFYVESNSTVSALAFNSTSSELSFTVSGPVGTMGYVKVTISKSLISNAENIKVYLDGNQLNYEVTSNANSWLLAFNYLHSTHQVRISLAVNAGGATLLGIEHWMWTGVAIIIVVTGVIGFIIWRTKKKEKP